MEGEGTSSKSSSRISSCSEISEEEEEEEEEEKICVKPPDPCFLCGEPAVSYDVEGNVIKRESPPPSRLQADSKDDLHHHHHQCFIKCIFKCFRVDDENESRAAAADPLPVCDSCEELVVLLLEMYDKVEELESKIRRKTRDAERKFLEEELYQSSRHDGAYYASLRGVLLVGGTKQNVQPAQQIRKIQGRKKRVNNHKLDQKKESVNCDIIITRRKRAKSSRGSAAGEEGAATANYVICENEDEELMMEEEAEDSLLQSGTIGDEEEEEESSIIPLHQPQNGPNPIIVSGRERSRQRKPQVAIISYAEESSSENGNFEPDDDDEQMELGINKIIGTEEGSESEDVLKVNPDIEMERKRHQNNLQTTRKGNHLGAKRRRSRYCSKIKEKVEQPPSPRPSNHHNPAKIKNDKICQVDPTTGNIRYVFTHPRTRTCSSSRPTPTQKKTILEFVKQGADSSYKCSSCSKTILFKGDSIDRTTLLSHARSFHPTGSCGTCPVCQKPVPSLCNKDYFNHRLSHLSELEKREALSQGVPRHPRFPPLETRRKISPESAASLHGDALQCPTCGKFIANGEAQLRRHEKTHLNSPLERKCHLCGDCGASFTTKYGLDIHTLQKHSSDGDAKLFKCPICKLPPRVFKTEKSLQTHMRKNVHDRRATDKKFALKLPFACPNCTKSFATGASLKIHVTLVHTKPSSSTSRGTTWTCQFCKKKFGSTEERLEHYKEAHPRRKMVINSRDPNQSVRCEYPNCKTVGFPDEASLQSHVSQEHVVGSSSTSSAQFMCSLCGKVVVNAWVLKQHHLVHSGERKHVCEVCNSSFPIRYTLLSHLASKHGQGPLSGHFKCEEQPGCCDKVFQCRILHKAHLRTGHAIFDSVGRHPKK